MGRRSFPGGIITSTELAVTGYGASGMWSTQTHAQKKNSGLWPIPGITPSGPLVGPTIANVSVTDSNYTVLNDTPYINSAGGYIKISGTGFASGAIVYVGGSAAVTTSFVSSTEIRAQVAAGATSNSFPVYVVNTDSSVAIKLAAVTYSGLPSWSTAATLSDQAIDSAFSIALSATGDSAITYSLAAGSSLPPGTSLSSGGVFSGTVTGLSVDTAYSFSVVANDAENQDSSRTFTVNVSIGDQYFNITPLLLNGEANVWVRDSSVNNAAITITGDARPVAFSPYATYWSAYFDGTGDFLTIGNNSLYTFGTSAYTIEFWYNGDPSIADYKAIAGNGAFSLYFISSAIQLWNGANPVFQPSMTVPRSRWTFIQIIRTSTATNGLVFYLDGVAAATGTDGTNWTATGTTYFFTEGSRPANGYVTDLRVSDVARTAGVPTAPLSSDANTRLLTLQNRRFVDNSSNASTITRSGDAAIKSFSPFAETDLITGSAYFDGTGDYLALSTYNTTFGAGDFTVECWVYMPVVTNTYSSGIIATSNYNGVDRGWALDVVGASGYLRFYLYNSSGTGVTLNTTTVLPANQWTHLAAVRSGTTVTIYMNGASIASGTNATTDNFSAPIYIGTIATSFALGQSGYSYAGYISNARIVVGTAVYTGNFTPQTSSLSSTQSSGSNIAAITGTSTSLLTLQYRRGDNNHRFVDESGVRALTTRAGNASQGSYSPHSPAGWSVYFDGSTSYLNSTIGTLSGTWTVEFWVNMPTLGVQYTFINLNSGGAGGVNIWRNTSNQLVVDDGANAQTAFSTVTFATAGVWYHVAVTRDGTTTRGYINGVLAGTNTFTPASVTAVTVGRFNNNPFFYLLGYMSNLRVVDGAVVYTGAFTPPITALTATQSSGTNISAITAGQTLLLALQDNRYIDANTTPKTITVSGSPKVQPFSPFRPSASYTPATHGGSAYFDGSGDYVYITNNPAMTLVTNNHTIEFWMYLDGSQAQYSIPWYYNGSIVYYFSVGSDSGGNMFLLVGGGSPWSVNISTGQTEYLKALNNWTHVVITRSGTAFRLFLNGILRGHATSSISITAQTSAFSIGWDLTNATTYYKGWISNFRVINGSIPTAYQTASTTTGTTIFTPPTNVPSFESNTAITMNFTNGGIVDASGRNVIETIADTKVSNVQSKFGLGSLFFDGTGDYLKLQALPHYTFGTGDFTFECWVYLNSYNATWGAQIFGGHVYGVSADYVWMINTTGKLYFQITSSGAGAITSTSSVPLTTWTHIALVRASGTVTPYINGTSAGGAATYTTAMTISTAPTIGADSTGNSGSLLNGYIDDFRISRYARYTGTFTVPASAFLTK